ncbi:low molecular weight protein-tyrosine-phosphatase [Novibacillus thermophilus]|jgi:protein-tyrosine phosphatase|uniref:protein-tyrosine-phosphatase n=1 Tax=Novibacillus thermophilus TaxID=1471761 RepID=A0A1U9K7Q7_9BACL|nr:low molecular weight protein-tyrosine-phosphatase [Novibacillus thermophilus]AQS56058.1 protein tyrosine phosphatase [Novibacillus thermophilus]
MISVLFVCLGNICRSPMAEAVFRHKVKEQGLDRHFTIDSAGTGSWHIGEKPHRGTRELLRRHKIDFSGIVARKVSQDDLATFDYLIAMDDDNLDVLKKMAGNRKTGKVARLLDFVPEVSRSSVPDPYYTGNFDEVYDLIDRGCERLLAYIREKEGV